MLELEDEVLGGCAFAAMMRLATQMERQEPPKETLGTLDLSSSEKLRESAKLFSSLLPEFSVFEAEEILARVWRQYGLAVYHRARVVRVDHHVVSCFVEGRYYAPTIYIFLHEHRSDHTSCSAVAV